MKILIAAILIISATAWSKTPVKDFNEALLQGVQKDIKDETNDKFRKVGRGPASASVEYETEDGKFIEDTKKIDKSNFRQIGGPSKW